MEAFVITLTIFVLAIFVGFEVITKVPPRIAIVEVANQGVRSPTICAVSDSYLPITVLSLVRGSK